MAFNIPYVLNMYILFDLTGQTTLINFEAKFVTATGTDSLARYSLPLEMILPGENPFLPVQESAWVDEATFLYFKTLFDNPFLLKTLSVFAFNSLMFSKRDRN